MKDTKYRLEPYSFYDPEGIRRHLEAMAQKGWLLDGIFLAVWRYRRISPGKLHFTVIYDPEMGAYDPAPAPGDPLPDLCAHSGWTLTASSGPMQIYYSRQPHPVPIETDPAVMVENIHRMAKKALLPSCGLFLGLALLSLFLELDNLFTATLDFLSNSTDMLLLLFALLALPLSLGVLAAYSRWRKKALAAAELGQFLSPKCRPWANLLLWLSAPFLFFGWTASAYSTIQDQYTWFRGAAIIILCLLVEEVMRKKRAHRDTTQGVSILLCIILAVALAVAEGSGLVDRLDREYSLHGWQAHPPLVLADLGVAAEADSFFCTGGKSPLLGQLSLWEAPDQGDGMYFRYRVIQVKCPALYALCREKLLAGHTAADSPAEAWGAQEACRFTQEETDIYLLFYPDVIAVVAFPWSPTPAQMALVGERLGTIRL